LAKAVGCNATQILACLSNPETSAAQIKQVIEANSLAFNPVVDNRTLISNPALRRSLGFITQVPAMIGSNAQEGRIFVRGQNNMESYISNTFKNNTRVMKAVVDAYPVGKTGMETPFDAIAQIMTEYSFQCVSTVINHSRVSLIYSQSTALWANTSASVGIPTWRYYVSISLNAGTTLMGVVQRYISKPPDISKRWSLSRVRN
jgi:carboxylesterase type B